MAHLVFVDQSQATTFAANIDAACGYPKDGRRRPGGIHGSGGRTIRHSFILKHRTRNQWAYEEDPVVIDRGATVPAPVGATRMTLDPTWNDATPQAAPENHGKRNQ